MIFKIMCFIIIEIEEGYKRIYRNLFNRKKSINNKIIQILKMKTWNNILRNDR